MPASPYGPHPEQWLHKMSKGYQGVDPCEAKIVFLGLDANWPAPMSPSFAAAVKSYLKNPVAYWKAGHTPHSSAYFQPIHHPLLSVENKGPYNVGGIRYHQNFNKLNLPAIPFADCVSFVELLRVPTQGSSKSNPTLFRKLVTDPSNASHLQLLHQCLFQDGPKVIYVSDSVLQELRLLSLFSDLFVGKAHVPTLKAKSPPIVPIHAPGHVATGVEICLTYHFSASQINAILGPSGALRAHIDSQAKRLGC